MFPLHLRNSWISLFLIKQGRPPPPSSDVIDPGKIRLLFSALCIFFLTTGCNDTATLVHTNSKIMSPVSPLRSTSVVVDLGRPVVAIICHPICLGATSAATGTTMISPGAAVVKFLIISRNQKVLHEKNPSCLNKAERSSPMYIFWPAESQFLFQHQATSPLAATTT